MLNVDVSKSYADSIIRLVSVDRRTSCIRISINRYANGVDLSPLAWSVAYKNADGDGNTDVIGTASSNGRDLAFDWIVPDAVSAVTGTSEFYVFGTDGDRKWQSATMHIDVIDAMDVTAEYDEQAASDLDVLIANATIKVNELIDEYDDIISRIDDAVDDAGTRVTALINDVNRRAAAGEFNGADGRDGVDGRNIQGYV